MDIETIFPPAVGYILKAISESKAGKTIKEDLLKAFWLKVRPKFVREQKEIENLDSKEAEEKIMARLSELIKDESFLQELATEVEKLQNAGIKVKNIVRGSIQDVVGDVHIGDKTYNPNENYDRKNILEGDVKNVDSFRLGDG